MGGYRDGGRHVSALEEYVSKASTFSELAIAFIAGIAAAVYPVLMGGWIAKWRLTQLYGPVMVISDWMGGFNARPPAPALLSHLKNLAQLRPHP